MERNKNNERTFANSDNCIGEPFAEIVARGNEADFESAPLVATGFSAEGMTQVRVDGAETSSEPVFDVGRTNVGTSSSSSAVVIAEAGNNEKTDAAAGAEVSTDIVGSIEVTQAIETMGHVEVSSTDQYFIDLVNHSGNYRLC